MEIEDIVSFLKMKEVPNEVIQAIVDRENQHVDEFNEVFDSHSEMEAQLSKASQELTKANEITSTQHEALKISEKNCKDAIEVANKASVKIKQLTQQNNVFIKDCQKAEKDALTLRKELKRSKAQITRTKEANSKLVKSLEAKDKQLKLFKEDATKMGDLPCIYNVGNEKLFVFPCQMSCNADGANIDRITVLLFTDNTGVFQTVFIDADDNLVRSKFLRKGHDLSEEDEKKLEDSVLVMSTSCHDYAFEWLIRVNRTYKGKIGSRDLVTYTG